MNSLHLVGIALIASLPATGWAQAAVEPDASAATDEVPAESAATSASSIVFGDDVDGELVVLDAHGQLVTRVYKEEGDPFVLRLEPGRYTIEWRGQPRLLTTNIFVGEGEEVVMGRGHLLEAGCCTGEDPIKRRGPRPGELDLRPWRLTLGGGMWSSSVSDLPSVTITDHTLTSEGGGFMGSMSLGYRVTPEWMVNLRMESRVIEATESHFGDWHDDYSHVSAIASFSVGAHYYLPPLAATSKVKPYLSVGIGPTLAIESEDDDWWENRDDRRRDHGWTRTMAAFGGHVGAGVDIQASSCFLLGADLAYHVSSGFSEPLAGHDDGTGLTFGFHLGFNFGGRMRAPVE